MTDSTDSTDSTDEEAYTEAVTAVLLRTEIASRAASAVQYGAVDREWANTWLLRIGAQPVTGTSEYRMNVPITAVLGWRTQASSRAEAVAAFKEQIDTVAQIGKITYCSRADRQYAVYDLTIPDPAAIGFFSGPADPPEAVDPVPGLDGTKTLIRDMLREGVAEHGWGHTYANAALDDMGLEPLPGMSWRHIDVPVTGTATLQLRVFDDATDDAVQRAAQAALAKAPQVSVKAEEIGAVRDSSSWKMVDEDVF
jgi:hypothetical protein